MHVAIYATKVGSEKLLRPGLDELAAYLADEEAHVWVDIEGSTDEQMVMIVQRLESRRDGHAGPDGPPQGA